MRSQKAIFQDIVDSITSVIDEKWKEIVVSYQTEDSRSRTSITFLYKTFFGRKIEKSLPNYIESLSDLISELRSHLSEGGKQPFTKCEIHIKSDGDFNAKYSYDEPDWSIKTDGSDWNFKTKYKE